MGERFKSPCDTDRAPISLPRDRPASAVAVVREGSTPEVGPVSFVVSFARVRGRPPSPAGYGHPRSRTAPDWRGRWCALLKSVLVSPRISTRRARMPRTCAVSDSGSGMGAEVFPQLRSDAVYEADRRSLTCADACEQVLCTSACPVRDEEAAGSNPATPTREPRSTP
jgi:hypothetical protein